ncbi:MAG: putative metal-binding motif-containing protein [Myxococcota bacterium]
MSGGFEAFGAEEILPPGTPMPTLGCCDRLCVNDNGLNWDCDDGDPDVFPEAPEICDGKDNDCDGLIDEEVLTACIVT